MDDYGSLYWKPNFKPSNMDIQSTLACVKFSTLPLENFDNTSLLSIGVGL